MAKVTRKKAPARKRPRTRRAKPPARVANEFAAAGTGLIEVTFDDDRNVISDGDILGRTNVAFPEVEGFVTVAIAAPGDDSRAPAVDAKPATQTVEVKAGETTRVDFEKV